MQVPKLGLFKMAFGWVLLISMGVHAQQEVIVDPSSDNAQSSITNPSTEVTNNFNPLPLPDKGVSTESVNSGMQNQTDSWEQFGLDTHGFTETDSVGNGQINFNDFPQDFLNGITIRNRRWAAKMGGYVKADLIHDYRSIDSQDFFDPATIPVGEPQRTNTNFHARQTRLNLDTRWVSDSGDPLRIMVEGDFFGENNSFRLRHAYGEYEGFIVGQTWTTLTHRAALPNTLDNVGDVASVGRRQTQMRYSRKFFDERLILAASIEDSRVLVDDVFLQFGEPRTPFPDFIMRGRWVEDHYQLQLATVARKVGFQLTGQEVIEFNGVGLNTTGLVNATPRDRFYGGLLWGTGIGSYRDLPDVAPIGGGQGTALESLAWYVGLTHSWNDRWQTNVTYSEGDVNNTVIQPADSINRMQYLATNLIWQPTTSMFIGSELLWGVRINNDGAEQDASRILISFGFLLP